MKKLIVIAIIGLVLVSSCSIAAPGQDASARSSLNGLLEKVLPGASSRTRVSCAITSSRRPQVGGATVESTWETGKQPTFPFKTLKAQTSPSEQVSADFASGLSFTPLAAYLMLAEDLRSTDRQIFNLGADSGIARYLILPLDVRHDSLPLKHTWFINEVSGQIMSLTFETRGAGLGSAATVPHKMTFSGVFIKDTAAFPVSVVHSVSGRDEDTYDLVNVTCAASQGETK